MNLLEDPAQAAEIAHLERMIARLEAGLEDPLDFQRYRLENGIYGIRGASDRHMVRVKLPFGRVTPEQLEALAEAADRFTPHRKAHLTTRQAVQLHHVQRRDLPELLRHLARAGLTTREACGNTVRNVTACPYAGIAPDEPFDVTPYAEATFRYFLRHPVAQNLPRKFKIAFEGCRTDHARVAIHDIGAVAVRDAEGRPGFRIHVGGGLGAAPRAAVLLEPFTPAEDLIPTIEAVLRVFDRHGNRKVRTQARLKFLVKQWGADALREAVLAERRVVKATRSGRALTAQPTLEEEGPPELEPLPAVGAVPPGFAEWAATNVVPQRQAGWATVIVRCPLGDVTSDQLRALARIARRYNGGRVRSAITQNLLLRWVPEAALPQVYAALHAAGLAAAGGHTLADVTRCPGADTCNLAITRSRGLAQALQGLLETELRAHPALKDLTLKISGCPNSCGQHHIADIGFYGAARTVDGREVPHYVLLLGGGTTLEGARFGKPVARIPARRVPEAVRAVLERYLAERQEGEGFTAFVDRVGPASFKPLLEPFTQVPPYAEAPEFYTDLGGEGAFRVQVGEGECGV